MSPRRTPPAAIVIGGIAGLACLATAATGASWKGPVYPKGAVSTNLALAVTPAGKATVLFQGPKRSISALSRTGSGAAWSTKPITWLPAGTATVNGPLAAGFAGSRLAALWTSRASLRSVAGSQARATTKVRARNVTPRIGAIGLAPPAAGTSSLLYSLASPAGSSMGTMAPGALPSVLPSAVGAPPAGTNVLHQDNDAAGNMTALVLMSPTQVGVMTRPAGGAWSAASPLPVPLQTKLGPNHPFGITAGTATALDVDATGNAVIAVLTNANPTTGAIDPAGTGYSLAVMQRQGAGGAFGAPAGVPNTQPVWFGGFGSAPPVAVATCPAAVVVGWGGGNGSWSAGGGAGILSSIAAPGQPFPAATFTPIGSTENWNPDGLVAVVSPTGMGAVMMWGDGADGDAQDLGVTTSLGPGSPWSKEFNLAGRNSTEGGYPGATIIPFNRGFVAAWSACVVTDPGSADTCRVGMASFQ